MTVFIGLCIVFFGCTTAAMAEFTGPEGSGAGESTVTTLTGGGVKLICESSKESPGQLKWAIEKEGSKGPQTKGTRLVVDDSKWGACQLNSSKQKKEEAKVGECEYELKQPGEETRSATFTVTKGCTIKSKACEMHVEAEGNKELKEDDVYNEADEATGATVVDPIVEGLTTKASSACELVGITSSKDAVLEGMFEVQDAAGAPVAPILRLSILFYYITAAMEAKRSVTYTNFGLTPWAAGNPTVTGPLGIFTLPGGAENTCTMQTIQPQASCKATVVYNPANAVSGVTYTYKLKYAGAPVFTFMAEKR